MSINQYQFNANKYAASGNDGTAFLAFKYLPKLIKKYVLTGNKTLDYGAGTGNSSSFLQSLGLNVFGVDISLDMLKQARKVDSQSVYVQISTGKLPFEDNFFDFVFSSFVFFEISSLNELSLICNEIYRVLKKNGIFLFITGSEHLYSQQWLSLDVNYLQNLTLNSGDVGIIRLKDVDLILYDYFWTTHDYNAVINSTQFTKLKHLQPRGKKTDGFDWKDEKKFPPYSIFVLKKIPEATRN